MKRALTKYTKRRLKALRRMLKQFGERPDQEMLHKIRVEIKKIKALLRLLQFHDKKFNDHKAFIPFQAIYRTAGLIREPYVMRALVAKFADDTIPLVVVDAGLIMKFKKRLPKSIQRIRQQRKKILKVVKDVKSRTCKKYLRKRKKELKESLYPRFRQADLHKMRKRIKEILYLSSLFRKKKKEHPFYDKSAALIGDWHDKMLLIQTLRKSDTSRSTLIKELQQKCMADLKTLRVLIRDKYKST